MSKIIFLTAFFTLLSLTMACNRIASTPPDFEITTTKPDARVEVTSEGGIVYFDVMSESGIGGAKIHQVDGAIPQRIHLRLHLKGLEHFAFSFAENRITINKVSETLDGTTQTLQQNNSTKETPIARDSSYWMTIGTVSKSPPPPVLDGYFEIQLPRAYCESRAREFSIEWIDFYR